MWWKEIYTRGTFCPVILVIPLSPFYPLIYSLITPISSHLSSIYKYSNKLKNKLINKENGDMKGKWGKWVHVIKMNKKMRLVINFHVMILKQMLTTVFFLSTVISYKFLNITLQISFYIHASIDTHMFRYV